MQHHELHGGSLFMKEKKEFNIQIGEQIRKARENNNLTQEKFAEIINKSPQFISDLERGVYGISLETLKTICEKLNISSDAILFPQTNRPNAVIDKLTNQFYQMTPEQLRIMEALTNAFLQASRKDNTEI